jgi:hypothetical protein
MKGRKINAFFGQKKIKSFVNVKTINTFARTKKEGKRSLKVVIRVIN